VNAEAGRQEDVMTLDLTVAECDLLRKVLDSYLSELRTDIAATKRDTGRMHAEETMINELQRKLSAQPA
jgi:hypothetical protein